MVGFLKMILIAILASVGLIFLMNISFFFPWYMTIVETTYELSQIAAYENYIPYDIYREIDENLRDRPIFRLRADEVEITVESSGKNLVEQAPYDLDYYYELDDENAKPYIQRGNTVRVEIYAEYPFQMTLGGKAMDLADIPVRFGMDTMTLKHFKDLLYYENSIH